MCVDFIDSPVIQLNTRTSGQIMERLIRQSDRTTIHTTWRKLLATPYDGDKVV